MKDSGVKILVVDDEPQIRDILRQWLMAGGFSCTCAATADEAQKLLREASFDLVISDIIMPGMSGIDLLTIIRSVFPDIAVLMVTALDDRETGTLALKLGAYGYLIKPLSENEVLINVANALERRRLTLLSEQYERVLEARVQECVKELTEQKEALRRSNDELERVVEERTRELRASNEQLKQEALERRKKEEALRQSEMKYRSLVENSPVGIVSCDTQGRVTELNQAVVDVLGADSVEAMRKINLLTFPPLVDAGVSGAVSRCLEGGKPVVGDHSYTNEWGSQIQIKLHAVPIRGSDGSIRGAQAVLEDVSQSRAAHALRLRSERLKAMLELASGVARNFNNSLRVVETYAQMTLTFLRSQNFTDIESLLEQISESNRQTVQMVRSIQQFARAASAIGSSGGENFDLSNVVHDVLEKKRLWFDSVNEADWTGIRVDSSVADGCHVLGDRGEVAQVIVNLLKNAVEAVPSGGTISISTCREKNNAVIEVKDDGVGIAKEDVGKIFEPFWTTRKTHSGMGLSVSLGIVRRHRGTISVSSKRRKGTTVTVKIPLVKEPARVSPITAQETANLNFRILLIDGDLARMTLVERELKVHRQIVFTAESVDQGLRMLKEFELDAIVCRLALPGMNGWDAAAAARRLCGEMAIARPAFILVTEGDPGSAPETLPGQSDVDGVLPEPFTIVELLKMLVRHAKLAPTSHDFSGRIRLDILEYVQIMLLTDQKAILEITSNEGEFGQVFVDQGRVLHAASADLQGEDAFYKCMTFRGGRFSSRPWREPEAVTINKPGEYLLVEAARRRDEASLPRRGSEDREGSL